MERYQKSVEMFFDTGHLVGISRLSFSENPKSLFDGGVKGRDIFQNVDILVPQCTKINFGTFPLDIHVKFWQAEKSHSYVWLTYQLSRSINFSKIFHILKVRFV